LSAECDRFQLAFAIPMELANSSDEDTPASDYMNFARPTMKRFGPSPALRLVSPTNKNPSIETAPMALASER
jgi:hypothetical protein